MESFLQLVASRQSDRSHLTRIDALHGGDDLDME